MASRPGVEMSPGIPTYEAPWRVTARALCGASHTDDTEMEARGSSDHVVMVYSFGSEGLEGREE